MLKTPGVVLNACLDRNSEPDCTPHTFRQPDIWTR